MFTASGQVRSYIGTISDSSKPLRVTLAWTDAPGSTSGAAYVNNLDLTVTAGGNTYKGNVFVGADSVIGGTADPRNNVESVFLPAGLGNNVTVTVTATNISGNGVPNVGGSLDQDYALVAYNFALAPAVHVLAAGNATIVAESCNPPNGVVDPGETVSIQFPLLNVGNAPASGIAGTLQASSSIISPGGPQNYATIPPGGSGDATFSFTANGTCGSTINATVLLSDGSAPQYSASRSARRRRSSRRTSTG